MHPTNARSNVNHEAPHNQPTVPARAFSLITTVAISALLGLGFAIAACVVLSMPLDIITIAPISAALGAVIGLITYISRRLYSKSPETQPKPQPPFQLAPPRKLPAVNKRPAAYLQSPYRRKNPQDSPYKPASAPIVPVNGSLAGIQLSTIHQLKLMSTPSSPTKRKLYECDITYINGTQEIGRKFTQKEYSAFLKALPEEKVDSYLNRNE